MKTTSTLLGFTALLTTVMTVGGSELYRCDPSDCPNYPPCGYPCMAARLVQLGCPDVACACPLAHFLSDDFVECLYEQCNATNKDDCMIVLAYVCEQAGKPFIDSKEDVALAPLKSNATVTVTTFWAQSSAFPEPSAYFATGSAYGANGGATGYGPAPDSSVTGGDPMSGLASTSGASIPTVTVVASSVRSPLPAQVTYSSSKRIVPHLVVLGLMLLILAVLQA